MAKLMNYVIIAFGMMILMNLAGLQTSSGWVLGQVGLGINTIQNFAGGAFWVLLVVAIGSLFLVSGAKGSLFGIGVNLPSTAIFAAAGVSITLAFLLGDFISVILIAKSEGLTWVSYVIYAVMVPFIIGFGLALFDWTRGND